MKPIKNSQNLLPETGAEYLLYERASGLKTGDMVFITRQARSYEHGWDNTWIDEMDEYVGKIQEIISTSNSGAGIALGCFRFPYFILRKMD